MNYLSLFSGIEAATQAWEPIGWECVGVSEIETFPCYVLAHRYPRVPNLGDVRKIGLCARYLPETLQEKATLYPRSRLARLYQQLSGLMLALVRKGIDAVVFGSPCQDLSVAGKRKGFEHADGKLTRSGLFHIAIDIVRWARKYCGCRFALWENVPGAFTSNAGRDFAAVVEQMAGLAGIDVPPKGWGTEGCAVGEEAMVEWATLDAQWFGVAQRRRRVFALADFGDWASRPPILLEPDRLRGDSAPARCEGGELAATGSGAEGCWWDGGQVAQTLDAVLYKKQAMPEKNRFPAVIVGGRLRYITPVEAERLQGMADGWTAVPVRGRQAADVPRYKAIGNSMASVVMNWIGRSIEAASWEFWA